MVVTAAEPADVFLFDAAAWATERRSEAWRGSGFVVVSRYSDEAALCPDADAAARAVREALVFAGMHREETEPPTSYSLRLVDDTRMDEVREALARHGVLTFDEQRAAH